MKTFEYPVIEVIAFTAESIMNDSTTEPTYSPENNNGNATPWA